MHRWLQLRENAQRCSFCGAGAYVPYSGLGIGEARFLQSEKVYALPR